MPYSMFRTWHQPPRPGTADVLYSEEEVAFLKAIDRWRREHGDRTPDCREVLKIARELGYRKTRENTPAGGSA
jgi:hypothetical protein